MGRKIEFTSDEYYHLYNRGVDKRVVFQSKHDSLRFQILLYLCNSNIAVNLDELFKEERKPLSLFEIERDETLVSIGAYCLMPNHFHILVKQNIKNGVSKFMQKLGTAYTMYFNNKNNRTGSLFQGTFKAKHANKDEYLKYLFAYIHLNPVKLIDPKWKEIGIKDKEAAEKYLKSYEYSSFLEHTSDDRRPASVIISKKVFPEYFSSNRNFKHYLSDWLTYKSFEPLKPRKAKPF